MLFDPPNPHRCLPRALIGSEKYSNENFEIAQTYLYQFDSFKLNTISLYRSLGVKSKLLNERNQIYQKRWKEKLIRFYISFLKFDTYLGNVFCLFIFEYEVHPDNYLTF